MYFDFMCIIENKLTPGNIGIVETWMSNEEIKTNGSSKEVQRVKIKTNENTDIYIYCESLLENKSLPKYKNVRI